jgi:hypothetical protein
MDGLQHAVLASHVVRLGRHRAQGTAPEDIFQFARAQQICKIGVAARKLLYGYAALGACEFSSQIAGEFRQV